MNALLVEEAPWWLWPMIVALFMLLGVVVTVTVIRIADRRRRRRIARHAFSEEKRATLLFKSLGYRVIATQIQQRWDVIYGRQSYETILRADYLLEKGGRRYIADVKTGRHAANVRNSATRRQLLEYTCAYQVDGVLLADMEREELVEFRFPGLG